MSDQHFEEDLANYTRFPPLTRRQFATVSMGAGVAAVLPRAADALQVAESVTSPSRLRTAPPIAISSTLRAAQQRA